MLPDGLTRNKCHRLKQHGLWQGVKGRFIPGYKNERLNYFPSAPMASFISCPVAFNSCPAAFTSWP